MYGTMMVLAGRGNDKWHGAHYTLLSIHISMEMLRKYKYLYLFLFCLQHKSRSSPARSAATSPAASTTGSSRVRAARWDEKYFKDRKNIFFALLICRDSSGGRSRVLRTTSARGRRTAWWTEWTETGVSSADSRSAWPSACPEMVSTLQSSFTLSGFYSTLSGRCNHNIC